ncbi:MAG TPA: Uma2 family endonuclease [Polyangiaceae bacterium]|nr:Uma2 family endonuclease [Polyangiaceae bacterium]
MQAKLRLVSQPTIELRYRVHAALEEWVVPEGTVPESIPHSSCTQHILALLSFWSKSAGRPLFVARNLAVRWLETHPAIGIDPDVCLLDPPPPDVESLSSLCLWKAGHVAPPLAFEVVSRNHPYKDYVGIQERYATIGTRELVVFDPLLQGPKSLGGPVLFQLWRRGADDLFERSYAGPGPVYCETLEAWLAEADGLLRISHDRAGRACFLTEQEYERAEKERERAEKEHERAEKEHERAEKERERAEKERERAARIELEHRLAALESALRKRS